MAKFGNINLNVMKRYILISIVIAATLISCKYNSKTHEKLILIENLLDKELNDSALNEINDIDINEIKEEKDRALHNLLKAQILYRCYLPAESDSAINLSIRYYEKTSDYNKLAKAYYYKGAILRSRKDMQKAIVSLKQGEKYAGKSGDSNIMHHITEQIAFINMKTGNYNTALEYARKALKQSQSIGKKAWIAEDLNRISAIFSETDDDDSSYHYLKKALRYIKHTPQELKAELYANAGAYYFNKNNLTAAKAHVKKSLNLKPTAAGYYILGSIYLEQGKDGEAWTLWSKALGTDDLELKAEIMQWMITLKRKQGEFEEAAEWTDRTNKVKDSLKMQRHSEDILRLQNDVERNEMTKSTDKRQNVMAVTVSALACILAALAAYHRMRIRKARDTISKHQALNEKYSRRIEHIAASEEHNEREINRLRRKISDLREKETSILNLGRKLYDDIENGGAAVKWGKNEFEAYVEFCRVRHPELTKEAEKGRGKLTAYNTFFLILCEKGIGKDKIQHITGMSPGALRTLKYRLRQKEKIGAQT